MTISELIKEIAKGEGKLVEAIRFGITGGIATVLQYLFYLLFVSGLNVLPELSTIVSYGLSFVFNFFLSNFFTFRTKPNKKKTVSFAASHLINLGLQTVLVWVFCHYMPAEYALIPAMLICIPCNFLLVRYALKGKRFQ